MTVRHRDTNLTRCRQSWRERSEGEASSLLLDHSSFVSQFHKVIGKFYLLENLRIVLGMTMGAIFFNLRPSPNIRPFFLGNFQLISYPNLYNQVCCQFRDFVEINETTQMIKFYLNCYQDFWGFFSPFFFQEFQFRVLFFIFIFLSCNLGYQRRREGSGANTSQEGKRFFKSTMITRLPMTHSPTGISPQKENCQYQSLSRFRVGHDKYL